MLAIRELCQGSCGSLPAAGVRSWRRTAARRAERLSAAIAARRAFASRNAVSIAPARKARMSRMREQERDVGAGRRESGTRAARRRGARSPARGFGRRDHLGEHRVVVHRHLARLRRRRSRRGRRAAAARGRAAGGRPAAGSPAPDLRRRRAPRSRVRAGVMPSCATAAARRGDEQLRAHQVEAGDLLGDRMLDLQPRVHLEEVEAAPSPRRPTGRRRNSTVPALR